MAKKVANKVAKISKAPKVLKVKAVKACGTVKVVSEAAAVPSAPVPSLTDDEPMAMDETEAFGAVAALASLSASADATHVTKLVENPMMLELSISTTKADKFEALFNKAHNTNIKQLAELDALRKRVAVMEKHVKVQETVISRANTLSRFRALEQAKLNQALICLSDPMLDQFQYHLDVLNPILRARFGIASSLEAKMRARAIGRVKRGPVSFQPDTVMHMKTQKRSEFANM